MTRKRAIDLTGADGLDNEKRIRLLGIIDRLRELGISENVSLPQVSEAHWPEELRSLNCCSSSLSVINRAGNHLFWKA
jgi:hypothetical protein